MPRKIKQSGVKVIIPTHGPEQTIESRTCVAGVKYSDFQQVPEKVVREHIVKCLPLGLAWERTNRIDPLALKLSIGNHHIGYIPAKAPATLRDTIHELHQAGAKVRVYLTAYYPQNPSYTMLVIRVTAAAPTSTLSSPGEIAL